MAPTDRKNYFKLVAFIVNIAFHVIWKYISDNILGSCSFESFLNLKKEKHKLVHVYETNECCECVSEKIKGERLISRKQFSLLYKSDDTKQIKSHKKYAGGKVSQICTCNYSAVQNIDVKIVDITLANYIIQKCGKPELGVNNWIEQIKDVRNEIFHLSDTQEITDEKFKRKWTKLEGSVLGIATLIDIAYAAEIEKKILQTKKLVFIPDYVLKYEILCRDYWRHKCAEFERTQLKEIEKKAAALHFHVPEIFNKSLEADCRTTMKKIQTLETMVDNINIMVNIFGNEEKREMFEATETVEEEIQRVHIPVMVQLDIPTSWDKHKVFEVIDAMRLKETSDMNVRIKAVLTDDLDMFAEIANTVLRNVHDLRTEVNILMSSILTEAKINTTQHAEVGFNLKIPDRTVNGWPNFTEGGNVLKMEDINICSSDFCNLIQQDGKSYSMDIVNRGLFLLISNNQEKPQNTENQSEEEEAHNYAECLRHIDFDVDNMFYLFKYLGYVTPDKKQLGKTKEEIQNFLKETLGSIEKIELTYDSLVVIFMSGKFDAKSTMIYDKDGEVVPMDDILEIIKGCRSFEGKPKVIIVQTYNFNEERDSFDRTDSAAKGIIKENEPNTDDVFVVSNYSRIEQGPWIIGENMIGSYFVQALIHVFKNHAHEKSFMDLLEEANSCLAQAIVPEVIDGKNSGIVEETTVAKIVLLQYCIRKRLYFFPGM